MIKDVIVGVSRTLSDIDNKSKWNNKLITWVITHNTPEFTKQYTIEL